MHQPPIYTTWKVTCQSAEEADALKLWLNSRIDLDRVLTDTVRVAPNGVEQVQTVKHRLGNYFSDIHILVDSHANGASYRLVFQRRPDAGRLWKDLMVKIVQEIEGISRNSSIQMDSKGDVEPISI
jgi:hypothetical protein